MSGEPGLIRSQIIHLPSTKMLHLWPESSVLQSSCEKLESEVHFVTAGVTLSSLEAFKVLCEVQRRTEEFFMCLFQSVAKETRFNFILYHRNCPAVAPVRQVSFPV